MLPSLRVDPAGPQALKNEAERLVESIVRVEPVAVEPEVLDRGNASSNAVLDASPGELVEDADVFDDPQRMVKREELHHRAEPDPAGGLGGGGEKDLLVRRQTQVGAVMLRDVVAGEAGGVEPS